MGSLTEMLVALREQGGSDLHLAAGQPPRMRRKGSLDPIEGAAPLDDAGVRALLREIATPAQWESYEQQNDLDFAYGIPGVARFRANYFAHENGAGAVFRIIPEEILTLEELALPKAAHSFAHLDRGLVLVTGPTGSGKSTTLAAIINEINEAYAKHVLTIEDPIEFVHPNKRCVFSHREVGIHSRGFAPALRAALREDADVILVGEMRDYETISLALAAAEMGALVFGTLHTNGAAKTIDRVIDAFPADEQPQARLSLSESLAGVVSQQLLRTADGKGRCAANEVLIRTSGLANVIREGNTPMLLNIMQSGKAAGMQTMDDALLALVQANRIRPADAYFKATDKARFEQYAPAE
ncbi:MAG: type IV pilus twitching motility protein PilT [Deltaproteobacteria bacterium]|nr:type IV pilus twitching motility protein PilT [Deltaproteobacteria bacterium]